MKMTNGMSFTIKSKTISVLIDTPKYHHAVFIDNMISLFSIRCNTHKTEKKYSSEKENMKYYTITFKTKSDNDSANMGESNTRSIENYSCNVLYYYSDLIKEILSRNSSDRKDELLCFLEAHKNDSKDSSLNCVRMIEGYTKGFADMVRCIQGDSVEFTDKNYICMLIYAKRYGTIDLIDINKDIHNSILDKLNCDLYEKIREFYAVIWGEQIDDVESDLNETFGLSRILHSDRTNFMVPYEITFEQRPFRNIFDRVQRVSILFYRDIMKKKLRLENPKNKELFDLLDKNKHKSPFESVKISSDVYTFREFILRLEGLVILLKAGILYKWYESVFNIFFRNIVQNKSHLKYCYNTRLLYKFLIF